MQLVFVKKRVEAAARTVVRQFDSFDIEGNCTSFLRHAGYIARRHEHELGFLVDKALD